MKNSSHFRINGVIHIEIANWMLIVLAGWWLVVACTGCAATKPLTNSQTLVTDSTSLRQVQRLVAVSVPGDSARLNTQLVYDARTGRFKPVTIFSHAGHTSLAFTLDALGFLQATAVSGPYVAQVPVTDTETTRTRKAETHTQTQTTVRAKLGGFARFCIWFTVLAFVGAALWCYIRFFTPIRFLK